MKRVWSFANASGQKEVLNGLRPAVDLRRTRRVCTPVWEGPAEPLWSRWEGSLMGKATPIAAYVPCRALGFALRGVHVSVGGASRGRPVHGAQCACSGRVGRGA